MNIRTIRILVALVALSAVLATSALAREVKVFEPAVQPGEEGAEEAPSQPEIRSVLLEKGFGEAVLQEALGLLPGPIGTERTRILARYLGERASRFVESYVVVNVQENETGTTMVLDVTLNRNQLRMMLRDLGVLANWRGTSPYTLVLESDTGDALAKLGELHELSGLYVRSGAEPTVYLNRGEEAWGGRLEAAGVYEVTQAETLEDLWPRLWGAWFQSLDRDDDFRDGLTLHVSGWFTSDGARAFGDQMKEWGGAVQSASLVTVSLDAAGVAAMWRVRTVNPELLRARLDDYLPPRNLDYRLEEGF